MGNAVKYTSPDVTPHVRLTSRRDLEPGWVRVEVADNGIGIPEGQEELIFEEFHRGPVAGRSAGTGLGLALTRRIVALHGGQLTCRSEDAGGSTFAFTLPRRPDPRGTASAQPPRRARVSGLPRMAMFCSRPTAAIEANIEEPP